MSDRITIPYRPEITPPYRPGVDPLAYTSSRYTNPDARLRPLWPPTVIPGPFGGDEVTAASFPALYADFTAMLTRAGLPRHRLIIADAGSPYMGDFAGRSNSKHHVIHLNRSLVNFLPYESLVTAILGHELGHEWRAENPRAKSVRSPAPFTPLKQTEYEADIVGVCLRGSTAGMHDWMKTMTHGLPQLYPTNDELRAGMAQLRWSECPVGGLPLPEIPYYLRPVPPQKKR